MTKDKALALINFNIKICEREVASGRWGSNFEARWRAYGEAMKHALRIVEQIDES